MFARTAWVALLFFVVAAQMDGKALFTLSLPRHELGHDRRLAKARSSQQHAAAARGWILTPCLDVVEEPLPCAIHEAQSVVGELVVETQR